MKRIISDFKTKISKEPVFGLFSKTTDPAFIECMGYAGLDFVILDMEHGPCSLETMQNLIRAANLSHILSIVRVKEGFDSLIGEVLDIGANGIQVPHVRNVDDVKKILELGKFYPQGNRGMCRFVRAAHYSSIPGKEYFKIANDFVIVIQIEGKEAIENLDDIITHGGFDIMFVGPYDLSQSLGVPGQTTHPLVQEKIAAIYKKCSEKNIILGSFYDNIQTAKKWIKMGFHYISYSVDMGVFTESCSKLIAQLKQ